MSTAIGVSLPRLATAVGKAISEYAVLGKTPGFTADFIKNKYPGYTSLSSAITHSRSGNAVMTDGYGPELVTNGGFDSGTDSWTDHRDAVLTVTDGKLNIALGTNTYSGIVQEITLKSGGGTYDLEFDFTKIDANARATVGTTSGGSEVIDSLALTSSGKQSVRFTTTTETVYVKIYVNSATAGESITIDNVSVREMPVLKWAPHNLLRYSEELDNAAWTKSQTSVTSNQATAPDGSSSADLATYTTNSTAYIGGSVTGLLSNHPYNIGFFAKYDSKGLIQWLSTGSSQYYANFDIENGVLGSSGTLISNEAITDVGGGWYFCSFTVTLDSNDVGISYRIYGIDALTDAYAAGSTSGGSLYLWGAHLYRSDLGGMAANPDQPPSRASYVPTTSTAEYLPRIGHHVYNGSAWVNEGLLAESEARTNLVTYSSDISSAYWSGTGGSRLSDVDVANPTMEDVSRLRVNTAADNIRVYQATTRTTTVTNTFSGLFKADGITWVRLRNDSTGSFRGAYFDLENGVIGTVDTGYTATIQDCGNGWYRCALTAPAILSTYIGFNLAEGDGDSDLTGYSSTSDSVLVTALQWEDNATPSSYIPTSGSTVTRPAETFTIPSANLPWPEPQYTGSELVTNGTFDTDTSGWTAVNSTLSLSSNRLKITNTAANGYAYQQITTVAGKVYALNANFYLTTFGAYLRLGTTTGTTNGITLTESGNYTVYFVADDTSTFAKLQVVGGSSGDFVEFDNISVREINPLSVSIAMDGAVTYADENVTNTATFWNWFADSANRLFIRLRTESSKTGQLQAVHEENNTSVGKTTDDDYLSPDVLVPYDMASRFGTTFLNLAESGVALSADTTPTALPDLSATDLTLAPNYMGTIGTFRVWDRDLGDDGIVEATNPSLEPSLSLTFEGTGTNSFVVNNWSE